MSATLLRIAKLLPMLGTSNDNERLVTLSMIERTLRADGLSFTDAGTQLGEFVRTILNEPEPEVVEPPKSNGHTPPSWTSATPPPQTHHTWSSAGGSVNPNPPPRQPPPPRPPPPPTKWTQTIILHSAQVADPRGYRVTEYEKRVSRYLNIGKNASRPYIRNQNERQFLEDMYFRISSGNDPNTLTQKQRTWLDEILNRAPISF